MTIQELKENFIIDVATKLIFDRSIFDVTIKDIAKEAGVGEMTVYRYFNKKQNIILAVALRLEKEVLSFFDLSKDKTGFDKISTFYNSYLKVFTNSPKHFEFIRDFDSYMLEFKDNHFLTNYEENLVLYKNMFFEAYELGLKDGSIKNIDNIEMFYYTSTHSILELCKKLTYGSFLDQDNKLSKVEEIQTLINIFLNALKNR